jgi:hypothetical protein
MKSLKLLILLSGILNLTNPEGAAQSFNWNWAQSFGGQFNEYCTSATSDNDSNLVMTGSFKSSILSLGSFNLTNTNSSYYDFYVAKINPEGNVIWAVSGGSDNSDLSTEVAVSSDGSIFIGGHFSSSSMIIGSDTLINTSIPDMPDLFVAKLDSDGNFLEAISSKGDFTEMIRGIATDGSGNLYIGGGFMSDWMILGNDTLFNNGIMDVFLAKLDNELNVSWTKHIGGESSDLISDLQTDNDNNVFISGCYYSQDFYFDTTYFSGIGNGYENAYNFKCNSEGELVWYFIPVNSGVHSTCERIAPAGDGNFYLAGRYKGNEFIIGSDTLALSADDFDFWIAKFSADHSLIWTNSMGSDLMDYLDEMVAIQDNGLLFAGEFLGSSLTIGSDTLYNTNPEISKAFIARFDDGGMAQSATGLDGNGTNNITSLVQTGIDEIFVSGIFTSDTLHFGNQSILNAGEYDIFCASVYFTQTQIQKTRLSSEIIVYPNPAHERINLRYPKIQSGLLDIKIYNSSGVEIRSEKLKAEDGIYHFDVSNLEPGIYFIFLESTGKISKAEKIAVF